MAETPFNSQRIAGSKPLNEWIEILQELVRYYGGSTYFSFAGSYTPEISGRDPFISPRNIVLPAITGTAQVGQILTSATGTWDPTGTYSRQWFTDGVAISGATAATYVPVVGDIGKVITVRVTATNNRGSTSATSTGTAAVIVA